MEQAIKLAIEGGWSVQKSYYVRHIDFVKVKHFNDQFTTIELDGLTEDEEGNDVPLTTSIQTSSILLDPLFWQSLGKQQGLGIEPSGSIWQGEPQWKINLHRFVDHLADGKSIDSFFVSIIK